MLKISLRNSRKYISKFREIVQTQENFIIYFIISFHQYFQVSQPKFKIGFRHFFCHKEVRTVSLD